MKLSWESFMAGLYQIAHYDCSEATKATALNIYAETVQRGAIGETALDDPEITGEALEIDVTGLFQGSAA